MAPSSSEPFTTFTPAQAAAYTQNRGGSYPEEIYTAILAYTSASPSSFSFLDVGTGPGKVIFDLLPRFPQGVGYGCDAGAEMIAQARREAQMRGVEGRTRWACVPAERCVDGLPGGERVRLVTVGMAAHWFDMPSFYASAASALAPGGTLAMWTSSSQYIHPNEPNHTSLQQILFDLEDGMLAPYASPGNLLTRHAYDDLLLPWQHADTRGLFDEASFKRIDWDRDGIPSTGKLADGSYGRFLAHKEESIEEFAKAVGSASLVIRWREANPENAGTEMDPVSITKTKLRAANGGRDELVMSQSWTLLLMRRGVA